MIVLPERTAERDLLVASPLQGSLRCPLLSLSDGPGLPCAGPMRVADQRRCVDQNWTAFSLDIRQQTTAPEGPVELRSS